MALFDSVTTIQKNDFLALAQSAEIWESSKNKPKVFFLPDSKLVYKIFYPKDEWWSSDHFYPKAKRFVRNAQYLKARAINAPIIQSIFKVYEEKKFYAYAVTYPLLHGLPLRQLEEPHLTNALLALPAFIAELHAKGIWFRSLHAGNILWQDPGFALIDIANVKFFSSPLSAKIRQRNIAKLLHYPKDHELWQHKNIAHFNAGYEQSSST